jgi:hypothetical protein
MFSNEYIFSLYTVHYKKASYESPPRWLITPNSALETNQGADKTTSIGIAQPFQELCLSTGRPPHLTDMFDAASTPSRLTDTDISLRGRPVVRWGRLGVGVRRAAPCPCLS